MSKDSKYVDGEEACQIVIHDLARTCHAMIAALVYRQGQLASRKKVGEIFPVFQTMFLVDVVDR